MAPHSRCKVIRGGCMGDCSTPARYKFEDSSEIKWIYSMCFAVGQLAKHLEFFRRQLDRSFSDPRLSEWNSRRWVRRLDLGLRPRPQCSLWLTSNAVSKAVWTPSVETVIVGSHQQIVPAGTSAANGAAYIPPNKGEKTPTIPRTGWQTLPIAAQSRKSPHKNL